MSAIHGGLTFRAQRAPAGGTEVLEGHYYKGGQFVPFYVPRELMPQVDFIHYPRLIAEATVKRGRNGAIGVTLDVIDPHHVTPHQRVDKARARAMPEQVRMKPIIVSNDDFVLDGNHRWFANVLGNKQWVNVIRLNLPFDTAITWLRQRPYVYEIIPGVTPERV